MYVPDTGNGSCNSGTPQYNWLVSDLAANQGKAHRFVVLHSPPYSSGTGHGSDVNLQNQLGGVFQSSRVDAVFAGHDHDYERTQPINGVLYIVSAGGGASLYPVVPQIFSAYAESTHHVVFVTVDGCSLTLQAIKPDGTIFDSTTLTKACLVPTPESTPDIKFGWQIFLPVIWKK